MLIRLDIYVSCMRRQLLSEGRAVPGENVGWRCRSTPSLTEYATASALLSPALSTPVAAQPSSTPPGPPPPPSKHSR